jgi:molecular chaperone DnaJ
MKDFYQILGVSRTANLNEIKKAYRKLARKYHPDLNPGDKASEQRFKEITEAYEVLKDTDKRKQFDTYGNVGPHVGGSRSGKSNFEGFDFTQTGSSSFGDIFETIFGNYGGFAGGEQAPAAQPQRGEDLHYSINLSFTDAASGIETPIQITHKTACQPCSGKGIAAGSSRTVCPVCKGKGRIQKQTGFMKFGGLCTHCGGSGFLPGAACSVCGGEGRVETTDRIRVKIPAGVDDGSKVRIADKGNIGRQGGPAGDLIITIQVMAHKFFRRNGSNLEVTVPITFSEAALGAKVEVPTLEGQSLLKIPPGTFSGQKLRLKGKGVVNPKTKTSGDMIIDIRIVPPPTQDLKVRELLKELEKVAPYSPRTELQ